MRTICLLALPLALLACGEKDVPPGDSSDTDTDTDTDTDSDSDADSDTTGYPSETGFDYDGAWYPLGDGSMFCQSQAGMYIFSSGALREGTGPQGNAYANFQDIPTPGSYEVVAFDGFSVSAPDAVGVWVLDLRDSTFWYSDGTSGTLEVFEAGGALDVVWQDVSLVGAAGTRLSEQGWLRCAPE